jgi:hypothetical protein
MTWDDAVYYLITAVVIAFIAWLLFSPASGHDPLLVLQHSRMLRM